LARQGLETARKLQHPAAILLLIVLSNTPQEILGLEKAHAALLEAVAGAALTPPWKTTAVSKLCVNRALAGDWEAARRYALEVAAIREAAPTRFMFFDFERYHETEALLRSGEESLARENVRRLGERVGHNRRFRLVYLRMLAVLNRWDGDIGGALANLREAEALAQEIGLPGELWQIRAALGELHEESGDDARARDAFSRAAETLRSLAGRIDDPTLQASFLETPQVRHVLER